MIYMIKFPLLFLNNAFFPRILGHISHCNIIILNVNLHYDPVKPLAKNMQNLLVKILNNDHNVLGLCDLTFLINSKLII